MKKKRLFVLDLDHTLIYGSYAPSESAKLLFQYNEYLKVYERPYARELIELVQSKGDVIVFTTAKRDYAERTIQELGIRAITLYARDECKETISGYKKKLPSKYSEQYDSIRIIDDDPGVWMENDVLEFLKPSEFLGDLLDKGLVILLNRLQGL